MGKLSDRPHFHKRLEFPFLYIGWFRYAHVPGSIFLDGLVCRLPAFLVKRREKPEQVLSNVRLHRGKGTGTSRAENRL